MILGEVKPGLHQKVWGKKFLMCSDKKLMWFNELTKRILIKYKCACPTLFEGLHSFNMLKGSIE
jgi:hypothetical protein